MKLFLTFFALILPVFGAEYAVFSTGARLRIDRHEPDGDLVRLYAGGGFTEMPAASITAFERDDYTPPQAAAPAPVEKPAVLDIRKLVDAAAAKYGLPPALLRSLVRAESNFRTNAVSPKGAIGPMQLMPGTARMLGADPSNPAENVEAGARYLWQLLWKYDTHALSALAAYNAGPGAVDRHNGIPPYRETREYVRRVWETYRRSAGE